jgi:hypothetical protein
VFASEHCLGLYVIYHSRCLCVVNVVTMIVVSANINEHDNLLDIHA